MIIKKILSILLILFLINTSCSKPQPKIQNHATGKKNKYPQRIISLGPAITKALFQLGVGKRIVGNTVYCKFPEAAKKKKKIGDLINFNLESIIHLNPDFVVYTPLANSKKIEKLKKIGIIMKEVPMARNFQEIAANFLSLGDSVGKKDAALEIVNRTMNRLNIIEGLIKGQDKKSVFFQIGMKPLATVSKRIFLHDAIIRSGGLNIAEKSKTVNYSYESVVAQDPDIIIISSMGFKAGQQKKIWTKYRSLIAVKRNQIFIVDSDLYALPLPGNFLYIVKDLSKILHPEIFVSNSKK